MVLPLITSALGAVNGSNQNFSTPSPYMPGSLRIFLNGDLLQQDLDNGWVELTPTTFKLTEAPLPGDYVQVYYTFSA